jgi:hypothetical protein
MKAKRKKPKRHHRLCTGHLDCPNCGPGSCAYPIMIDVSGRVMHGSASRALSVACLGCKHIFSVKDAS